MKTKSTASRQGKPFIVKIRRLGELGFEQEAWRMGACRAVGVPMSEVLLLDRIQDGEGILEVIGRFSAVAALVGVLMMVNRQLIARRHRQHVLLPISLNFSGTFPYAVT